MAKAASAEDKAAVADQRRVEQALERQKRQRERAQMATLWSRRDVFGRFAWGLFGGFAGISLLGFLRSAFPRVLFQPPTTFKAGYPADYLLGAVSEKYVKEQRVWLIRIEEGIYALFAKCTHLGCTPRWLVAENKFKCPCHGSGYYMSGVNFEGPAPRPLERLKITKGEDGQILVDKSIKFLYEKGQWGKPGSMLKV